jgi:hypothetical protein
MNHFRATLNNFVRLDSWLSGEGANKSYRLNPTRVGWTFRSLIQLLSREVTPTNMADPRAGQPVELRRFLDETGRLTTWPARRKDQVAVLHYLASHFEPGRYYTETEVNAILNNWHTYGDPATLRRDLYDERLFDRTSDGSRYWREEAN